MTTSSIPFVDERSFEREVLQSELPVVVDFQADWCGPCKTMAPELEAAARELTGKAKFVKVNVDKVQVLAAKLGIQSVPTTVVFASGRPVAAKVGALRRAQLRQLVEPFFPRAQGAITATEAAMLHRDRAIVFVDTREPAVYARAHLPAAVNFPLEELPNRLAELHMLPAPPVVYCRSGDKTKTLSEELAAQGFSIPFLEGGLLAWEAEGFAVERPD